MSEISKRMERAEKYLQKGKLSPALDEFRALLTDDPTNEFARQRAADLCLSLSLTSEATEYLGEIFDHAVLNNRASEAVQTYKKLQRLGPVNNERTFKYAQLVEHTSPRESLEAFKAAFQSFVGTGDKPQALTAIKHMVALDPSAENYRREAELSVAMGDRHAAALAYFQLGEMEEGSGRDSSSVFEQAYSLEPDNPSLALAHARCLLRASRAEQAVEVLRTHSLGTADYLETYANALLMANQLEPAEPVILRFYEQSPKAMTLIGELLSAYLKRDRSLYAVGLAKTLEPKIQARGGMRDYLLLIQELADKNAGGTDLLEYLAQFYNSSNREHEYCDTLRKLFELHFAHRNFMKAAECLDRASEVDAYEPGHAERLETLRGKIDANKFNTIANRLSSVARTRTKTDDSAMDVEEAQPEEEKPKEPTVLEDLMLQAEIFMQYSMRSKAVERLERINKLFPREEDKREKLAQLFAAAGFVPKYDDMPEGKSAASSVLADESAVDNFSRVTEITRNIARQSSVKSVLFATVNDVGRHWNVSRCVAGLSAPGKAPSAAMEYCAPGITKSDVMGLARLISTLQVQAVQAGGPISFETAQKSSELEAIRPVLVAQKIESLIAVPLMDGGEHIGIIILEQCGSTRSFRPVDQVVLNTIAEQIVLAVNNARLRSLVKTLAVTDEKSGLLRRSSYLDVLLSEVRRSLPQKSPVTLVLMSFGSSSALVKEVGEANVEAAMQEVGHAVTANIRQNDLAVRYSLTNVALILSETNDKSAFFVLDKLHKATDKMHIPGHADPVVLTAGIAELVMNPKYDAVDIVTEAINRVEVAVEIAKHEGGSRAHAMAPMYEASAVTA
jgi:GGDEF domain-containing protein/tetratricopeptide (TPR) repeat protein